MRIDYKVETDTMIIAFRDVRIQESDEIREGVIADFGYDGGIVRLEILNASHVVDKTKEVQFAVV